MWIELTYNDAGWLTGTKVAVNTDQISHITVHPTQGTCIAVNDPAQIALPLFVAETYAQILTLLGTIGRVPA